MANLPSEELLQAQAHVIVQTFNYINSAVLKCAIQLNIPDVIHKHGRPITITELVDTLSINKARADGVHRLMRFLVHTGFFVKSKISENDQEDDVYSLTAAGRLLLEDVPFSFRPFSISMVDPIFTEPFNLLSEWFKNDHQTPFEIAHGRPVYEHAGHDPRINRLFNDAMASDSWLMTSVVIRDFGNVFEGIDSLVDVGGGTGRAAEAICEAFPHLECTVLDLPHVVDGLQGTNKLNYVAGDMFDHIPPTNAVFLKWILHNWSDEECVKLLKKCKEAISSKGSGGKVIILDMMVDKYKGVDEETKTHLLLDMFMMVHFPGKERNEKEWAKLFFDSGFTEYKITPIKMSRFLIELYPGRD